DALPIRERRDVDGLRGEPRLLLRDDDDGLAGGERRGELAPRLTDESSGGRFRLRRQRLDRGIESRERRGLPRVGTPRGAERGRIVCGFDRLERGRDGGPHGLLGDGGRHEDRVYRRGGNEKAGTTAMVAPASRGP